MSALETAGDPGAAELVQRIAAGDLEAEGELVERYGRGVLLMLLHLTSDRARAEDLRQDTLWLVLEKIRAGELREPEKLPGFIRGTARLLLLGEARRSLRRAAGDLPTRGDGPADPAPDPLARVLHAEDRRRLLQLLGELRSARDREVLFRYHVADQDRDRICRDLGLSSQQLNLVLFRARKRFGELLERAREEGGRGRRQGEAAGSAAGSAAGRAAGSAAGRA